MATRILRALKFVIQKHRTVRTQRSLRCENKVLEPKLTEFRTMTSFTTDKEELKKKLTPLQYHVTQEKGTERPFTGCYNKVYTAGTYTCIVCEQELFSSETKYDSSCGWPAFNDVLDQGKVKLSPDTSGGRIRTEVTCSRCGSHLGHVLTMDPPQLKGGFASTRHPLILYQAIRSPKRAKTD